MGAARLSGSMQGARPQDISPAKHNTHNTHQYSFAWAAITKYYQSGWLKQQQLVSSQLWRLEVQNQGISMVGFCCGFFLRFTDGCLLSVPSHGFSCLCTNLFSQWRHQSYGTRSHPDDLTLTLLPLQWPCLQPQSYSKVLGVRICEPGGHDSVHNSRKETIRSQPSFRLIFSCLLSLPSLPKKLFF